MKAKIIVGIIWAFFIFCGISGGLQIPDSNELNTHNQVVPIETKLGFTLIPLSFGLFLPFYMRKHQGKETLIEKLFDRMLGKGFSEEVSKLIHFHILAPLFFLLIGGIGLIKAGIIGLPAFSMFKLLMPLCFGIGMTVSFTIIQLFYNRKIKA